ncbi:MAG: hypothetical protein JXA92_00520 [candidate division Zixibacteria bacterium]|nr:hypothetical protein [candidate division Zixibacteria bacterium]
MPCEQVNVFIVHTPFQHLIVNHMLTTLSEFRLSDNYLVLDMHPLTISVVRENWKKVLALQPPVGASVVGSGKNCRRALKEINGIISGYPRVSFFVSDIDWPLNNAVFGLIKKGHDKNIRMCNYPDGLGSLLVQKPDAKRKLRNALKSLLGLLGGSPYYNYGCDIMGLAVSDTIYSLMPNLLDGKTDKKIVNIPKLNLKKSDMNRDACIFIGQYFKNITSDDKYRDMCVKAAEYTLSLGYSDLYYKPHHFANSQIENDVFLEYGFKLIADTRPIEEIFQTRQMKCAVSYISSALLHLKMMFGEDVRCISILGVTALKELYVKANIIDDMQELFRICGVEIHAE